MTQSQTWIPILVLFVSLITTTTTASREFDCQADTVFCLTLNRTGTFRTGDSRVAAGDLFFVIFQRLETHNHIEAGPIGKFDPWSADITMVSFHRKEQKRTDEKVVLSVSRDSESGGSALKAFQYTTARNPIEITDKFTSVAREDGSLIVKMSKSIQFIAENGLLVNAVVSVDGHRYDYNASSAGYFFKRPHSQRPGTGENASHKSTGIILLSVAVILVILLALIILAAVFGIRREYKTIVTLRSSRASTNVTSTP